MMLCKADFEELFPELFDDEDDSEKNPPAPQPLLIERLIAPMWQMPSDYGIALGAQRQPQG